MKTRQSWLKMSKVVIAWKIWTKGQIEVKNVKLNKAENVRNTKKALSSKILITETCIKEMLPRRCNKIEPLFKIVSINQIG